jgi:hypothetical protein
MSLYAVPLWLDSESGQGEKRDNEKGPAGRKSAQPMRLNEVQEMRLALAEYPHLPQFDTECILL